MDVKIIKIDAKPQLLPHNGSIGKLPDQVEGGVPKFGTPC